MTAGAVDALDCCGVLRNREELRQSLFCSELLRRRTWRRSCCPLVRPARQRVRAVRLCARPRREPELPLRLLLRLLVARPLPRGTRLRRAAQPRNRRAAPRGRGASPHTRAAGRDDGARTGTGSGVMLMAQPPLKRQTTLCCLAPQSRVFVLSCGIENCTTTLAAAQVVRVVAPPRRLVPCTDGTRHRRSSAS